MQIKYWADPIWQLYDCAHLRPEESHSTHQCTAGAWQGTMAGKNLLRAGGKVTIAKQRAHLFPPCCWHECCLFYQIQILHIIKGCNNLWNKPWLQLILYIFFLNNASARFIFHSESQDRQELAGPLIKEAKVALVLLRKFSLVLKAEANPTQIWLFKPSFKNRLATKFHWLTAWEPSRVF